MAFLRRELRLMFSVRHCGKDRLERTAKIHSFKLFGEFKTCEECVISKARQKNIKKVWKGSSQIPGERLYIDKAPLKTLAMADLNAGPLLLMIILIIVGVFS
jgi:hypothetical protein